MSEITDVISTSDRGGPSPTTSFISRQPLLDSEQEVCGYEILISNADALDVGIDSDMATRQFIDDGILSEHLENLTPSHKAFITIPRDTLVGAEPGFLPPGRVVIQLSNIEADSEVLASCARLKQAGYSLALSAGSSRDIVAPFLSAVDLVKTDCQDMSEDDQRTVVESSKLAGVVPVATKVETYDQFHAATDLGYQYFQGFFFGQAENLSNGEIAPSKLGYLRVLGAVNTPDFDLAEVAKIIKSENSLSHLLLRYLNSAYFSFADKVESVQHAASILGRAGIRKWSSCMALSGMTEDKPSELAMTCLVRAAWCESIDMTGVPNPDSRFLLGLLSLADAVMDRPMCDVVAQLPISTSLSDGLIQRSGPCGSALKMLEAYEAGNWHLMGGLASELGTTPEKVAAKYLNALGWAHRVFSHA